MPTYIVKGKFKDGKPYSGERMGANADEVTAWPQEGRRHDRRHRREEEGRSEGDRQVGICETALDFRPAVLRHDRRRPSLVQCLEILGSQQENPHFAKVITATRQDVESGLNLADSMRKHPQVFDDLFCNMIAAGEAGGILDTILKRLATYIEKSVKLQAQIKGAMMYPVAVIVSPPCHRRHLVESHPDLRRHVRGLGAELPLPPSSSSWLRTCWSGSCRS